MSSGRLAGKEAAYFFQESKQAVTKLAQKNNHNPISKPNAADEQQHLQDHADVLPEVLKHSLPSKLFRDETVNSTSSSLSKWVLPSDLKLRSSVSPDALNPLRGYVSLPQVTFGPKRSGAEVEGDQNQPIRPADDAGQGQAGRTILVIFSLAGLAVPLELLPSCHLSWWEMPEATHGVSASTANELRQDRFAVHVNPEKLKAASEGLANVGKAFAIATAVVFGGAAMVIGTVASKLELHNMGDLKTKGKDIVEPQLENIKNQFVPMKIWAENMSKKWHLEKKDVKQKAIVKDLSKILGAKSSSD
ncbi:hypothetical protein TSUD_249950 [Trifolium subterraneum]|nr:hypothetical protein TSUD_249950 [Trifolium subterraneum]